MIAPTLLLLLSAIATATAAKVEIVSVMPEGMASNDCAEPPCKYAAFRIPGLVAIRNTLLAFAEGRKFGCADFDGQHDLVMRRSTDNGLTWAPLTTLVDALAFPPWKNYHVKTHNAAWDPSPVHDRITNETFVFFNGPGREANEAAGSLATWMMKSSDGGVTWTLPTNMTSQCQRPGHVAGTSFSGSTPGDGHAVQLASGRLLVPMYAGHPAGVSMCYSDDHGKSWTATQQYYGDGLWAEVEVAETFADTTPPTLYMTIRLDMPHRGGPSAGGGRWFSTSKDAGLTWAPAQPVAVPDPQCKGSVVAWPAGKGLVLSNAASCSARVNQTIYVSTDNGHTWPHRQFVDARSGYSTLQISGDGLIANLYEAGGCALNLAKVDPQKIVGDGADDGESGGGGARGFCQK